VGGELVTNLVWTQQTPNSKVGQLVLAQEKKTLCITKNEGRGEAETGRVDFQKEIVCFRLFVW
jgi:hypothetical protein